MLSAENIQFSYGDIPLLQDVSVQLQAGKITALVGLNGSGKSTLMQVLCGLLSPQQGCVSVEGKAVSSLDKRAWARRCAWLSQQPKLAFDLTVVELVMLGRYAHMTTATKQQNEQVAEQAIVMMGLQEKRQQRLSQLSGGEQQRAHLARVLAQIDLGQGSSPRFLCLDEHLAHVDLSGQQQVCQQLKQLASQGVGILMIVHDVNMALRYADRVWLLQAGRLVADDAPKVVLQPDHVKRWLGYEVELVTSHSGQCALVGK